MLEELFKSSTSVLLLGVIIGLLIIQILLSSFSSKERREPPGPRPFLLLGNLLQVDPKRLDKSLFDVRNLKKKKLRQYNFVIVVSDYESHLCAHDFCSAF